MTATLTPKQTPSTDKQKATVALITRALHNNSAATAADIRATFGNILARLAEDSRPEGRSMAMQRQWQWQRQRQMEMEMEG